VVVGVNVPQSSLGYSDVVALTGVQKGIRIFLRGVEPAPSPQDVGAMGIELDAGVPRLVNGDFIS
jgi:hypothetical protein